MVLNLNKTHIINFASSKLLTHPLNIVYKNQALTVSESIKFLGRHLDCNLTWKSHIENLVKKTEFNLLLVEKIITHCKCKSIAYGLFCTFLFTYQLWYSFLRFIFINEKCFHNSKRAIRIMLRLGPRSSCIEGFKKLDILTVPCLYIYALVLFAVKNFNIYQTNSSVHSMNTRQQNKLHIPSVRLSSIQRGVYYSSVKIFNQLPQNIFKYCYNIHTFKTLLRDLLTYLLTYSMEQSPS